jgi:hypothetical protein
MSILNRGLSAVAWLVFAMIGFCQIASAQSLDALPIGSVVRGNPKFQNVQIPLPPGDWVLVSTGTRPVNFGNQGNTVGAFNVAVNLTQLENGKIVRLVKATTNKGASPGGWGRDAPLCDQNLWYFRQSDKNYNPMDIQCWAVGHVVMFLNENANKEDQELFAWSVDKGLPGTMIGNRYQVARNSDYISVAYFENPEAQGFPATSEAFAVNPWHRDRVRQDTAKVQLLEKLKKEGEARFALVKKGLERGLPETAQLTAPAPAAAPQVENQPSSSVEERLARLQELVKRGLISEEDAARRRGEILKDM